MALTMVARLGLVIAAVLLAGCPVKPSRFPDPPFISTTTKLSSVAQVGITIVQVSCPTGTRIGGGFVTTNGEGLLVRGSYPDDSNGWIVEVESTKISANEAVTAHVYCLLRHDTVVTVERMGGAIALGSSKPKQSLRANCPAGSALTGGGFRIDGPLTLTDAMYNGGLVASAPDSAGWTLEIGEWLFDGTRLYASYAVCTSAPIRAGSVIEIAYANDPTQAGPFFSFSAKCTDPGQFTTAGGYRFHDGTDQLRRSFGSLQTDEFANWEAQLYTLNYQANPPSAIALCLPAP